MYMCFGDDVYRAKGRCLYTCIYARTYTVGQPSVHFRSYHISHEYMYMNTYTNTFTDAKAWGVHHQFPWGVSQRFQ